MLASTLMRWPFLLIATLLLCACASIPQISLNARPSPAASPGPTAVPTSVPQGWTLHQTERFQIALPDTWQVLPVTEKELLAVLDEVRSNNSQVAAMLDQVLKTGSFKRMNFFAIEVTEPGAGVNNNLNVNHASVEGTITSQQALDDATLTLQRGMTNFNVIGSKAGLTINKLDVAKLQYDFAFKQPDGSSLNMRGVQFYMIDGSEVDVVTITGPPTAAFLALADRIGNSFSLEVATLPAQPTPIAAAVASPAPTPAALPTGVVTHGGNLRSAPKIAPETVVGQVCPDDQVAFLDGQRVGTALWYHVRITTTANNCDQKRVAAGTEGWVNSTLLSAPSAPVPIRDT